MPIYEYEALKRGESCRHCRHGFEILQGIREAPLSVCPSCGRGVRRVISWCRALVLETPAEQARVESRVKEYERSQMWSHAAELADKHSEKTGDRGLKMRALDNYRRAGYDADTLARHADPDKK
jgi:putative FmdB family regulatory protein